MMWYKLVRLLAFSVVLLVAEAAGEPGGCSRTSEDEDRNCSEEEEGHDHTTQYFVWIGLVSGMAVFVVVVFVSCVCCRCCMLHKQRRAHEALLAASMASRDHMSRSMHQSQAYPVQHWPANQRPYTISSHHGSAAPEYSATAPPVFPDEPPPKYTP